VIFLSCFINAREVELIIDKSGKYSPDIKVEEKNLGHHVKDVVFSGIIFYPFRMNDCLTNTVRIRNSSSDFWTNPKNYKEWMKIVVPDTENLYIDTDDYFYVMDTLNKYVRKEDRARLESSIAAQKKWFEENRVEKVEKERYTLITSEPAGAKIEINGAYVGKTPVRVKLTDYTTRSEFSNKYDHVIIYAFPVHFGQQTQFKYLSSFTKETIPENIYFNMNLVRRNDDVNINIYR